jgi:XRE family transcriptional regulator, regulator of sulfur utilization
MEKGQLNELIGKRLKYIRVSKGLSLDKVAELTGVSKPMLGQIERAHSNPTVSTLWKIAEGLKVPFSAFIEESPQIIKRVTEDDVSPIKEDQDRFEVYPIFPTEDGKPFEIYLVKMKPGCAYSSNPHPIGVEEYLWVTAGKLTLECHDASYTLLDREGIRFRADTTHKYINNTSNETTLLMVIHYPVV